MIFFPSSWPLLRKSRILTIHRTSKSYNRETKIYVDSYSAKKKRKKTRRKKSFPRDTYEDESRELHSKIIRFIGKVVHTTVNERAKIHMQANAEFINEIRERTAHAIHFLLNITFNILHMFRKSSWEWKKSRVRDQNEGWETRWTSRMRVDNKSRGRECSYVWKMAFIKSASHYS